MRRIVALVLAMTVMMAASGCCGWLHGYGGGYNSYYGSGGCPGGNCGVNGGPAVIPQSTYYNNSTSIQAGVQPPVTGPITFAPAPYQSGYYPATALVGPWPTY